MDIGERLLHDPKKCGFHLAGKSPQVFAEFELNINFATVSETFDIPAESRRQTEFIEQGRVQKVRHSAQLLRQLLHKFKTLGDAGCEFGA